MLKHSSSRSSFDSSRSSTEKPILRKVSSLHPHVSIRYAPTPKQESSNRFWSEIRLTHITLFVTVLATVLFSVEVVLNFLNMPNRPLWMAGEILIFMIVIYFLIYGNLVYQITRIGYFKRTQAHRPATGEEIESLLGQSAPTVAILIPAFKEEPKVVFQTILSAVLQEYSNRRVVLLIDDPPEPDNAKDLRNLEVLRGYPHQIREMFKTLAAKTEAAWQSFRERSCQKPVNHREETQKLANLYDDIATWFEELADDFVVKDHIDRWFVEKILWDFQKKYIRKAQRVRGFVRRRSGGLTRQQMEKAYQALIRKFTVEICCFERKRYRNLSHQSNKAMNLNGYISLMGKRFVEVRRQDGPYLIPVPGKEADMIIPDAKYILTLDADSLLLPDYTARLVHLLEQPGAERIAVAQTPYSAFPHAASFLERIAGATTDIQYLIHQGFGAHQAAYWVGANALLRKEALEDIATTDPDQQDTLLTKTFIQDRTVIEDTESTIDLIEKGWRLHNYPARLAYSATPPDFGSLLIQRRRWSNGGLIIFPKLLRYLFSHAQRERPIVHGLLRCHYLTSIAAVNVGLLVILFYPFGETVNSLWLPFTAVPYFFLYGRDLVHTGYRWRDLPRVYALNLMLLPVNLGGVLKSLQQICTGQKVPFCRTPKVSGRTATPLLYLGAVYALFSGMVVTMGIDLAQGRWFHFLFVGMNAGFLSYAIAKFIGIKESTEDVIFQCRFHWLAKIPENTPPCTPQSVPAE